MDTPLPIWAKPHRFYLLDERQREVFTLGLVLTELRGLRSLEGVRSFGRRFGFEWLSGLGRGVHDERERVRMHGRRRREPEEERSPSELERFLFEAHGFRGAHASDLNRGPHVFDLDRWTAAQLNPTGEPPDEALRAFAKTDGALIATWSRNAFSMIEVNLFEWAQERERVPVGYGMFAGKRLTLTEMAHTLESVHDFEGHQHYARGYRSLYERAALELEDLAVRRPKPRICPLCRRVYIPLRATQSICGNQIWDATSRRLLRRCLPSGETDRWDAAEAATYRRRRKTRWTAMNRVRRKYGQDHPLTIEAIDDWEAWQRQNPPPRPPGRPLKPASDEPPFHLGADSEPEGS